MPLPLLINCILTDLFCRLCFVGLCWSGDRFCWPNTCTSQITQLNTKFTTRHFCMLSGELIHHITVIDWCVHWLYYGILHCIDSISAIYCLFIQCKALIHSALHLTFTYVVIVRSVAVLSGLVKVMSIDLPLADRRGREGEEDYFND